MYTEKEFEEALDKTKAVLKDTYVNNIIYIHRWRRSALIEIKDASSSKSHVETIMLRFRAVHIFWYFAC